MSAIRHLKNNLLVRNCWMIVTRAKNLFRGKKQFAKCADNVIITPPPTPPPPRPHPPTPPPPTHAPTPHTHTTTTTTHPYTFNNAKNICFGQNVCLGTKANISTPNAKFICKGHCAIAEGLTVHTGNHARIIGLYVKDITEANKPKGYDKDVVVEEDVWIGCNVTLLSGVTIGRGTT